jgi:hypothetical protein
MKKSLGISLMASAVLFVLTIIIGSLIKDNYNFTYNAISELIRTSTGSILIMKLLFYISYTILLFGGVVASVDYKKVMNSNMRVIYILLSIIGISGIFMLNFPCPTRNLILHDGIGIIHLIFYIITVIAMSLAPLILWLIYRESEIKKYRYLSLFSLITSAFVTSSNIFCGIVFLINIYDNWAIIQKIAISLFLIWMFVLGYLVYKDENNQI